MSLLSWRQQKALEEFRQRCRDAIAATEQGPHTDSEHNDLARKLGRPDLQRELQDELPLGPSAA